MKLEPFDGEDPLNIVADRLRQRVAEITGEMIRSADYKRLNPVEQIEAVMAGLVTGVVGVLFAHIQESGRDALMAAMVDYLPHARAQAEGIMAIAPKPSRRH